MPTLFSRRSGPAESGIAVPGLALVAGLVFLASVVGAIVSSDKPEGSVAEVTTSVPGSTTSVVASSTSTSPRPGISGFSPTAMVVIAADGSRRPACALLAESKEQQANGLMRQENLGGYDAMLFRFATDVDSAFYMANVRIPLSIAWLDASGNFVSSADAQPCTVEESRCPRYRAERIYRYAIEVPQGGLTPLGLGPGARIEVGGTCT